MTDRAGTTRRMRLPSYLVFGTLLGAGLVVRVFAMRSTWGQPDGDDAMVMMMSFRASHGHLALVFPGGNYGGALITWIEGPLVAVIGMKIWLFRTVDTAQCLIAAFLLRAIGRRFLSSLAADVAAGTFFFFPALWLFWSSREYIFWLPATVFAFATCLFVLRWFESPDDHRLWAAGLFAGLSIWSYPLVLPLVGPALAVLVWSLRRDRRALFHLAIAGFVGVAPWLAFFALHGRAAAHFQSVSGSRTTNLAHTVTQVLPTVLVGGARRVDVVWSVTNASSGHLAILGGAVYAAAVVYTLLAVIRRDVIRVACGASVVVWPLVLVLGHVPISPDTFRYGTIVVAPLLLLGADTCAQVRLTPVLAVAALILVVHTISVDTSGFAEAPSCTAALVDTSRFLVSEHRTAVWGSYWLSAPLEVCSDERVTASAVQPPFRDDVARALATSAAQSTYVVFPGRELDATLRTWTRQHHVGAIRRAASGFAVWEFDAKVLPAEIGLNSAF